MLVSLAAYPDVFKFDKKDLFTPDIPRRKDQGRLRIFYPSGVHIITGGSRIIIPSTCHPWRFPPGGMV